MQKLVTGVHLDVESPKSTSESSMITRIQKISYVLMKLEPSGVARIAYLGGGGGAKKGVARRRMGVKGCGQDGGSQNGVEPRE